MSLFQNYILDPLKEGLRSPDAGIPIPLPKLAKFSNYIERGQNVVISGRDETGKKSFMDYIYFLNVFKWWRDLDMPDDQKPPIKFYYFNLSGKERVRVQKWFCLAMKLEKDKVIDIPTLNSGIGRLYDLSEEDKDDITDLDEFMEDLEKHLVLTSKPQAPSDIYNKIKKDMEDIGSIDENGTYHLNDRHKGQLTFVYINDVDKLSTESDGFQIMNGDALKRKLGIYLEELRDIYKTNNIWVSPAKGSNSRQVRDTEPSYKDISYFSRYADLGFVLYNPFNENNNKYLGYPIEDLIIKNKNRLRTVTIVQNEKGVENVTAGLVFLGECGYFREAPRANDEAGWDRIKELLRDLP